MLSSTRTWQPRLKKLRPALSTLRVLSDEVEGASGVAISVAEIGHMATVKIGSGGLSHTLSLSISSSNDSFRIEETKSDSLLDEYATHVHEFQVAEQALELIINAVGKHIAQAAVLKERVK
jgi:hypothetical protein